MSSPVYIVNWFWERLFCCWSHFNSFAKSSSFSGFSLSHFVSNGGCTYICFALEHNNNFVLCLMITNWILTFSSPVFTFSQLRVGHLHHWTWVIDRMIICLRRGSCYVLSNYLVYISRYAPLQLLTRCPSLLVQTPLVTPLPHLSNSWRDHLLVGSSYTHTWRLVTSYGRTVVLSHMMAEEYLVIHNFVTSQM